MKLEEIAKRIRVHLLRFAADPKINAKDENRGLRPYYEPNAYVAGRYVGVGYISFQGYSNLTKAEAIRYLEWLDAGNVGRHYKALNGHE